MFSERANPKLTHEQIEQVLSQLGKHDRESAERTVELDSAAGQRRKLWISRGVFASDIMSSSIYTARFLRQNSHLFRGKHVLDMGCGTGLLGITMARSGAASVDFADISQQAIRDANRNTGQAGLSDAKIYHSNLFCDVPKKLYGMIVFNHPFFPGDPEKCFPGYDRRLTRSMLNNSGLVAEFLKSAENYLADSGRIVMPYFHLAGPLNDPKNHIAGSSFGIEQEYKEFSTEGTQLGDFSIYVLRLDRPFEDLCRLRLFFGRY